MDSDEEAAQAADFVRNNKERRRSRLDDVSFGDDGKTRDSAGAARASDRRRAVAARGPAGLPQVEGNLDGLADGASPDQAAPAGDRPHHGLAQAGQMAVNIYFSTFQLSEEAIKIKRSTDT